MKKSILILTTLLFFLNLTFAQKSTPEFNTRHKNIYVEFFGSSLIAGINFDMRFHKGHRDGLGFRTGIGGVFIYSSYNNNNNTSVNITTFPLELNNLIGKNRSFLISGIGILPIYANISGKITISGKEVDGVKGFAFGGTYLTIGYRFQPKKRGLMFQINWNPIFSNGIFSPSWFGISLGYGFK